MHKLAKGLKKKKKQKRGKKGGAAEEEDDFNPEELERYRRERAEAQLKAERSGEEASGNSDEWRKFEALTAGVDSILRKTQGDLDRIKSTSFFQRKPPLHDDDHDIKKQREEDAAAGGQGRQEVDGKKSKSHGGTKKWVGFDEEGNPVEDQPDKKEGALIGEDGFVDVPDDEDERDDSEDEDIFDTTYVDVLSSIDVRLAYIPDSPTEEEQAGDDPFDTSSADKVLKTVDKKGNRLVSLGDAVEVLSGRIERVSSCKLAQKSGRRPRLQQDLLLDDFEEAEVKPGDVGSVQVPSEPVPVQKTLLDDDDTDLPDVPLDLTRLVQLQKPSPAQKQQADQAPSNGHLDVSEFEALKEKTILEEIPDLDDAEEEELVEAAGLQEAEDPFASKEPDKELDFHAEIIEASFEAATFVDEEDPFDTTFAENILPGRTELKFIEKELDELPVSQVTISLTDPAGLKRDYETGLPTEQSAPTRDLLGGSATDLTQLADQPIAPIEEIVYVDPFDTSAVKDLPPGRTELKFLEKELLADQPSVQRDEDDDDEDFDPRRDEEAAAPSVQVSFQEARTEPAGGRRTSRPEALELAPPSKAVAFELPTPSKRPDLLATSEEEKTLPSKPLTPYYSQKSIEESLPVEEDEDEEADVDPFDTSFVAKVAPGKTELRLIEHELLARPDQRPSEAESSRGSDEPRIAERRDSVVGRCADRAQPTAAERQPSLLDEEIRVDAKPLTPRIEARAEPAREQAIPYDDPFDTSIASNILPGKAELRLLESELERIPEQPAAPTISLTAIVEISSRPGPGLPDHEPDFDPDFDPRAGEARATEDYLGANDQDPGAKALTPLRNEAFPLPEDVDPFDTSFASIGPGKTELRLLESELMKN